MEIDCQTAQGKLALHLSHRSMHDSVKAGRFLGHYNGDLHGVIGQRASIMQRVSQDYNHFCTSKEALQ